MPSGVVDGLCLFVGSLQEKEAFIISHLKAKGLGLRDEQGEEKFMACSSQSQAVRNEKQRKQTPRTGSINGLELTEGFMCPVSQGDGGP